METLPIDQAIEKVSRYYAGLQDMFMNGLDDIIDNATLTITERPAWFWRKAKRRHATLLEKWSALRGDVSVAPASAQAELAEWARQMNDMIADRGKEVAARVILMGELHVEELRKLKSQGVMFVNVNWGEIR